MAPEMMMPEEPMMAPELPPMGNGGRVSQESARYFGPDYRCGGCVHFMEGAGGQGECEIVAGPIEPEGVCSLFDPDTEALSADIPEEEAEPAEASDLMA